MGNSLSLSDSSLHPWRSKESQSGGGGGGVGDRTPAAGARL
ncbi:hypothetical protein [Microcoleus sp. Pol10D4]